LGEVDRALRTLDHYLSNIKAYLQREAEALPKAKVPTTVSSVHSFSSFTEKMFIFFFLLLRVLELSTK
jgi:hypothetical protein